MHGQAPSFKWEEIFYLNTPVLRYNPITNFTENFLHIISCIFI